MSDFLKLFFNNAKILEYSHSILQFLLNSSHELNQIIILSLYHFQYYKTNTTKQNLNQKQNIQQQNNIQVIKLITSYIISANQRREEYQFLNMTTATQNSIVPKDNYQQKCLSVNNQIIMDYEQDQTSSQKLYQSAHVDQLLQTSYVELETQDRTTRDQCINFNSGESFFQKTSQMVHSEMGNRCHKRMINKKLQCDIGSSNIEKYTDSTITLEGKKRRLAILKVIKLLRLVFKQARSSQEKIRLQILEEQHKNKELFQTFTTNVSLMQAKYADQLGWRDMKIMELELEIRRLSKINESLSNRLQFNEIASKQRISEIEEDKIKSLAEINEKSLSASLKVEQFQEQNETLEHQISFLQSQLANLQEISNNQEVYIKKLEYENGQFDKENQMLLHKQEQIIQQYHEHQQSYGQTNLQLCQANEQIRKLIKINDIYQKELQSTKDSVRRLEQINSQIVIQSEDIIMSQLNRYREQFNDQLEKIKRQHNEEIFNKNTVIDNLRQFQEKYMSYLSREKKANKKGILKKVDTNSSQNSINYQSEENIAIPNSVSSQSFINQSQMSENSSSQIYPDIQVGKRQVRRCEERKTTFKKIVQKQKPARSQKIKMKSLNQCPEPPKQPLITNKAANPKQFIFKAKDKGSTLNLKLAQYLDLRQETALSQNDKLSSKGQSKILKFNQNANKPGLLSQRK